MTPLLLALGCITEGTVLVVDTDPIVVPAPVPVPVPAPVPVPEGCVPNEAVYTSIAPIVADGCGDCHGEIPRFGAPMPLATYEDLVTWNAEVLAVLMDGSMPPENVADLEHTPKDTLVSWASCGVLHAPTEDGLIASRPVFEAGPDGPPGTTTVDVTANAQVIGPNVLDDYRRFRRVGLVTQDRFIRRIEPVIDDTRVLHHITLKNDDTGIYYYAWAPGTGPIEFPNGGVRLTPSTRLEVEIHYNNGAGVTDAVDSSGVRLFLGAPVGTEWAVASPQTWNIEVPPFGTAEASSTCTVVEPFEVLAGMPHMHQIGSAFSHTLTRVDGTQESLIELTGWSFEAQYIYAMGVDVGVGDTLHLRCVYENDGPDRVFAGLGTSDEMCYDFLYVTPASAAGQCSGPF
ncbi:MAG: hypothetical protein KC656_12310 [Myxococcales bacterium]|nr:hypothetical protein [Myxococcales bacterium]MCB9671111.1 hypothetical protein [Alphaproteobacteria bacterium]